MKAYYPIVISLTGEEKETLQQLRKHHVKIVDVFRRGLESWAKQIKEEVENENPASKNV